MDKSISVHDSGLCDLQHIDGIRCFINRTASFASVSKFKTARKVKGIGTIGQDSFCIIGEACGCDSLSARRPAYNFKEPV